MVIETSYHVSLSNLFVRDSYTECLKMSAYLTYSSMMVTLNSYNFSLSNLDLREGYIEPL